MRGLLRVMRPWLARRLLQLSRIVLITFFCHLIYLKDICAVTFLSEN